MLGLAMLVVHQHSHGLMHFLEQAFVGADAHRKSWQGQRHNHAGDLGAERVAGASLASHLGSLVDEHLDVVKHKSANQLLFTLLIAFAACLTRDQSLESNSVSLVHYARRRLRSVGGCSHSLRRLS